MAPRKKYVRKNKKSKSLVKLIKNVMYNSAETKHTTNTFNNEAVSNTGTLVEITAVSQGTDDDERVGENISVFKINGLIHMFNIGDANVNHVRFLIVQSKIGALTGGTFLPNYFDAVDLDDVIVLYDKYVDITPTWGNVSGALADGTGTISTVPSGGMTRFRIRVKPRIRSVSYDETSQALHNPIYVYFIAQTAGRAQISGYINCYYKDM